MLDPSRDLGLGPAREDQDRVFPCLQGLLTLLVGDQWEITVVGEFIAAFAFPLILELFRTSIWGPSTLRPQ